MKPKRYTFQAKVWIYPGANANWHFVNVPKEESEEIKKNFGKERRGWGSIPVSVMIGKTRWKTSVFPDKRSGTYLLPLKADVRKKAEILEGDTVTISLTLQV